MESSWTKVWTDSEANSVSCTRAPGRRYVIDRKELSMFETDDELDTTYSE